MNRFICLLIFLHTFVHARSQEKYSASSIPQNLKEGANIVTRINDLLVNVKDKGKAVITNRYAITVLNETGEEQASFTLNYSKLISVKSIEGTLYDGNGKKVRSLKKSEVRDFSDTDEGTLADDSRVKVHQFVHREYPYTVEYESVIVYDGLFFLPTWMPLNGFLSSVQESRYVLQCSNDVHVRYKSFNYAGEPVINNDGKATTYTWQVSNLVPVNKETYMPDWFSIVPVVLTAPADFEFQQYSGNMSDWKGFGQFIYTLNEGRNVLPANIAQLVHAKTDHLTDKKDKIRVLYEYLQQSTRYISIQLGIGGWQTFDARYVASKGYGDCKALTNYLHAMLKEAGVKSNYILIRAGRGSNDIVHDFSSNQFNHMILSVPLEKDTVWLECTNQTLPAGYLGDFTSNRYALMIDEQGGKLVRTPAYQKDDNLLIRKVSATLDANGHLMADVSTMYQAEQFDPIQGIMTNLSGEKLKEQLKSMMQLPEVDLVSVRYDEEKKQLPVIHEHLNIKVPNYASITGKRLFVCPNVLNKSSQKLNLNEPRRYDIKLKFPYTDIDTVVIKFPIGYKLENLPVNVQKQTVFGNYTATYKVDGETITYIRKVERSSGKYPAADYKAFAEFFNSMFKSDRETIVLVRD